MNYEKRLRSVAKRVAPNEPKLCANGRPGMGRGRKDEVQSTKDEKGRSCGIEEVVSGQFSVVSRVFSGDPQGSAGELRSTDFGLGIQQSEPGAPATGRDVRITDHAKPQWPNKAIWSQAQGRTWVRPTVASSGVGVGAARKRAGIVVAVGLGCINPCVKEH